MADSLFENVTIQYVNNSTMPTACTKRVNQVVVDSKLVVDFRDVNAGVIDAGFKRT